eukprot:19586-Heterococcus_DN1.PRE.1
MVSRGELLLVELNNYSGTWRAGLGDVTQRVHKFVMCLLLLVSLVRIYIRAELSLQPGCVTYNGAFTDFCSRAVLSCCYQDSSPVHTRASCMYVMLHA